MATDQEMQQFLAGATAEQVAFLAEMEALTVKAVLAEALATTYGAWLETLKVAA